MKSKFSHKMIAILIIACMMLTLIQTMAFAEEPDTGSLTMKATYTAIENGNVIIRDVDFPITYTITLAEQYTGVINGKQGTYRIGTVVTGTISGSPDNTVISGLPRAKLNIVPSAAGIGTNYNLTIFSADLKTDIHTTITYNLTGKQIIANINRLAQDEAGNYHVASGSKIGLYGVPKSSSLLPSDPVLIATAVSEVDGVASFNVIAATFPRYLIKEIEALPGQNLSETELYFTVDNSDPYEFFTSQAIKSTYAGEDPHDTTKNIFFYGDDYLCGVTDENGSVIISDSILSDLVGAELEYNACYFAWQGNSYENTNAGNCPIFHRNNLGSIPTELELYHKAFFESDALVICLGMNDGLLPLNSNGLAGDVNGDGVITAADAAMILRYIVKLINLDGESIYRADANCDGKITASDAAYVLRYVVGLNQVMQNDNCTTKAIENFFKYIKENVKPGCKVYIVGPWTQNKDYSVIEEGKLYSRKDLDLALKSICSDYAFTYISTENGVENERRVIGSSGYPTEYGYKQIAIWLANNLK